MTMDRKGYILNSSFGEISADTFEPGSMLDSRFQDRAKLIDADLNKTDEITRLKAKIDSEIPSRLNFGSEDVSDAGISWADMIADTPIGEPINDDRFVAMRLIEPSKSTPVATRVKRGPTTPITPSLIYKNNLKRRATAEASKVPERSSLWCVDSIDYTSPIKHRAEAKVEHEMSIQNSMAYEKWSLQVQLEDMQTLVKFLALERKFGA